MKQVLIKDHDIVRPPLKIGEPNQKHFQTEFLRRNLTQKFNFTSHSESGKGMDYSNFPEDPEEDYSEQSGEVDKSRLITIKSPGVQYDKNFPVNIKNLPIKPVEIYNNSLSDHNRITSEYRDVTGIYLWHNLVNGKQYIGSGNRLSVRLANYYFPSRLLSNRLITRSIMKYGHDNFSVVILEICGSSGAITKLDYLAREQYFIDLYKPELNLNPKADSSLGFKHTEESKKLMSEYRKGKSLSEETKNKLSELFSGPLNPFYGKEHTPITILKMKESKLGGKNPMYDREKSPEFIEQQFRDKTGAKNPMYGKKHSPEDLVKMREKIYVYDAVTKKLIKVYSGTVEAKKDLRMGYDTLKRCCNTQETHKGMILSLKELSPQGGP
jgi:group I intron endonuclease